MDILQNFGGLIIVFGGGLSPLVTFMSITEGLTDLPKWFRHDDDNKRAVGTCTKYSAVGLSGSEYLP